MVSKKGRSGDVWQLLTAVGAPAFSSFCSLALFLASLSSNLVLILRVRSVQPAELAEEEACPETHTVLQKWWQGKRSGASMTCSYISKGVELWVSLSFGFRVREFSGLKGPQGISSPITYSKQDQLWIQTKLLRAISSWVLKTSKSGDPILSGQQVSVHHHKNLSLYPVWASSGLIYGDYLLFLPQ